MSRLGDAQRFVDCLSHVRSPKGLEHLLSDISREMGFGIVTMFHHVDLSHIDSALTHMRSGELVGITTAPVSWSEYYRDHNLVTVDPRVLAVRQTMNPFRTDEMGDIIRLTSAQRAVIDLQKRANFGEGFTIPIHFPGEPSGSCTFVAARGRPFPTQNLAMANWVGSLAFQAGRSMVARARTALPVRPARLTERQLLCVILIGQGLREKEVAMRVGIAPETVKRHLKDARRSVGVAKSIQLVTHALHSGQISLYDLMTEKNFETYQPRNLTADIN